MEDTILNLLAGFVLEEFMLRFSASEFKNRFLLRNGTVLGLEQYRKKNILKLDFFCEPDERIPEKLLQLYLQKKEQSPVRWKGTISSQQAGTCLELQGQFEEMKVPVTVGIHFMHLGKIWGLVERQIPFLMDETVQIEWKEFPAELVLAKQIFVILRDMELIPDMEIYREVFFILRNETLNGRHVCELLEDMCKTEEMIPDMERAEQIFSYRDYPYMKKRWEKFCRHSAIAGTETLKWEEEMECFHHFLGDMWEAVCRDEVFFGDWMPELARFLG